MEARRSRMGNTAALARGQGAFGTPEDRTEAALAARWPSAHRAVKPLRAARAPGPGKPRASLTDHPATTIKRGTDDAPPPHPLIV